MRRRAARPPRRRSWSTANRSRRRRPAGRAGFDAAKKIKGRKRHVAVDTLGLPIECQITPADLQDRDALAPVLREVHRKSPFVTMSFVNSGYNGDEAQRAAFEASRISITVVQRNDKQIKGFIVLPKRSGRRTDVRLDQPSQTPRQRLRGDHRVRPRMAPHRPRVPAHATPRQALGKRNVIFKSGS